MGPRVYSEYQSLTHSHLIHGHLALAPETIRLLEQLLKNQFGVGPGIGTRIEFLDILFAISLRSQQLAFELLGDDHPVDDIDQISANSEFSIFNSDWEPLAIGRSRHLGDSDISDIHGREPAGDDMVLGNPNQLFLVFGQEQGTHHPFGQGFRLTGPLELLTL